jgi:hypothetical protein
MACPKKDKCNLYKKTHVTCVHGPYSYCGKYRTLIKPVSVEA